MRSGLPVETIGEASNLLAAAGDKRQGFGAVTQADVEASRPQDGLSKLNAEENKAVTVISEYVSKKIKVLLFFGTMCVLYIHAFNGDQSMRDYGLHPTPRTILITAETFFSAGVLRFAVPMFFMISGYLFFARKADDFPDFNFGRRVQSRVPSLVYPFISWNLIAIAVSLALEATHCPSCLTQVTSPSVLLQMWTTPVSEQLWYLRDLFLLAVLAPVQMAIYCRSPTALLACIGFLCIPWLFSYSTYNFIGVSVLELDGLIFFTLGGYLALQSVDMERKIGFDKFLGFFLPWVGLNACKAAVAFVVIDKTPQQVALLHLMRRLSIPFGVAAVWFGYDQVEPMLQSKQVSAWCSWLSSYSMWLYCAHLPLVCGGSHLLGHLMISRGVAQGWFLIVYLAYPIFCMALLLALGVPLSRHCSGAFALLTGGRGG